jgi:predicted dehydrogenase
MVFERRPRIFSVIKVALIGLGKMGLSHQAIINAHPEVSLVAVCDTVDYMLDVLKKYTGLRTYTDYQKLLKEEELDAIFIATPSRQHPAIVRASLERDLHVFCEKPFCLEPEEGLRLAEFAEDRGLVNQVGYHYRFVGAFDELKRLTDLTAIGAIHSARAEAYGPVVLRPKGKSWRSNKFEGGGCLYDYACHVIDLLNYTLGPPIGVSGAVLNKIFSADVDDEVYATLLYNDGLSAQIAANWSDESHRKMSTKLTLWGSKGKISADRQEIQVYLRDASNLPEGYQTGWNVRYTTDLTNPTWYYLRGEEYSAQIDHFVQAINTGRTQTRSTFRSAVDADRIAAAIARGANRPLIIPTEAAEARQRERTKSLWSRLRG